MIPRAAAAFATSSLLPIKTGVINSSAFKRAAAPKIRESVASGKAILMPRRTILNFKLSNNSTGITSCIFCPSHHTLFTKKRTVLFAVTVKRHRSLFLISHSYSFII